MVYFLYQPFLKSYTSKICEFLDIPEQFSFETPHLNKT